MSIPSLLHHSLCSCTGDAFALEVHGLKIYTYNLDLGVGITLNISSMMRFRAS